MCRPGGEEIIGFRVADDHTLEDISARNFPSREIGCCGATGRGWVRGG
jgi:hypothetical protein